jgi:hypothetical protein
MVDKFLYYAKQKVLQGEGIKKIEAVVDQPK